MLRILPSPCIFEIKKQNLTSFTFTFWIYFLFPTWKPFVKVLSLCHEPPLSHQTVIALWFSCLIRFFLIVWFHSFFSSLSLCLLLTANRLDALQALKHHLFFPLFALDFFFSLSPHFVTTFSPSLSLSKSFFSTLDKSLFLLFQYFKTGPLFYIWFLSPMPYLLLHQIIFSPSSTFQKDPCFH